MLSWELLRGLRSQNSSVKTVLIHRVHYEFFLLVISKKALWSQMFVIDGKMNIRQEHDPDLFTSIVIFKKVGISE